MGPIGKNAGEQADLAVLSYDPLPSGSAIRCERTADSLLITIPVVLPNAQTSQRQIVRAGLLPAGWATAGILLILGAYVLVVFHPIRIEREVRPWAVISLSVFCASAYLLVLWTISSAVREQVDRAGKRATVVLATAANLLVESADGTGKSSDQFKMDEVLAIDVAKAPTDGQHGLGVVVPALSCVQIQLRGGNSFDIATGRDAQELRWVANALRAFHAARDED
jgi:hypothetical protein